MRDEALITVIFLTVVLATVLKLNIKFKNVSDTTDTELKSTGDLLLDEIYADYPGLDPRR